MNILQLLLIFLTYHGISSQHNSSALLDKQKNGSLKLKVKNDNSVKSGNQNSHQNNSNFDLNHFKFGVLSSFASVYKTPSLKGEVKMLHQRYKLDNTSDIYDNIQLEMQYIDQGIIFTNIHKTN